MRLRRRLTVLSVLLADARRHRLQTATMLLGTAVGTAVVVAIHLASDAALTSFRRAAADFTGRATHQVRAVEPMPAARLPELLAAPGVLAAQPVIETTLVVPPSGDDAPSRDTIERVSTRFDGEDRARARALRLVGIDPFLAREFLPAPETAGAGRDGAADATGGTARESTRGLLERLLLEPGLALAPPSLLAELGLPEGGALTVRGPDGELSLTLASLPDDLYDTADLALAITDLATAAELLDLGERVLRFDLVLAEGADPAAVPLAAGERIERPERQGERAAALTRAFHANLLALGALALLVGAFLVFNMAQFAVTRRRGMLGKLRCLGCPARDLRAAVLLEASALGVLGGALGVLLGRVLAGGLVGDVARTVSTLYGPVEPPGVTLDAATALGALLVATGASVLACLSPARSAAATPPILLAATGLRERLAPLWLPAALLLGGAAMLVPWPAAWTLSVSAAGERSGFVPTVVTGLVLPSLAVLAVLLATATLVPHLLHLVLLHVPRSPVLALAADHLQRSLARAGAAAGALAMPIAMTIAIVVMVGSFRSEVRAWSQATLRGDLYVGPAFAELSPYTARLPDGLASALDALPEVASVDVRRNVQQPWGESEYLVSGTRLAAMRAHVELRFLEGEPEAAYAAAAARTAGGEGAALVSEPLARRLGIGVGGQLVLDARDGPRTLAVAGVFQDFALDRGYAIVDEPTFLELYGETGAVNAAVTLAPAADADALQERLTAAWPDAEFLGVGALREGVGRAFDQTFAITYVLQTISTVLALVGVLSALLCLHLERRTELGVLRALGATARTVLRLVLAEAALILAVAAAAAVPVGIALAWILVAVVNTRSFGWSFPLAVAPGAVAEVVLLALGAGLLAGLVPWLLVRRARIAGLLEAAR
ncbi:MAG: ABC transporter permease [Planctomycetota bacterium]